MAQYNLSHTGQQLDAAVEKYLQTDFNSFVSDSDLNTTLANYIPLKTPTNTGVFLRGDNTWSNILNTSEAGITGDTTTSIRLKVIHQTTGVQCGVSIAASGSNHGVWSNGYSDGTTFTDSASWIIFRNNRGELVVPHDLYVYGKVVETEPVEKAYGIARGTASYTFDASTTTRELSVTLTTHGRPVFLAASGDLNPTTADSAWFNIDLYLDSTQLCKQIAESHGNSWNIPFHCSYLTSCSAGSHTFKVKFTRGAGTFSLSENGAIQAPNFSVFEI